MIKKILVTNYLGESLELELAKPEKSGFAVKLVNGLGPSKANLNIKEGSIIDGGTYNSGRITTRNIVMNLIFMNDGGQSIETLRQKTYKYFPTKKEITLRITADNRICDIIGIVEHNDPVIFDKTTGTQISIQCPDPFFYSVENGGIVTTVFSGIEPWFEFPFSNESLTENLIEFSKIQNKTENVVIYYGDADVGITIQMHALGDVVNPTIYNVTTREFMKINTTKLESLTGHGIIDGDDIYIMTEKGSKRIYLQRAGNLYNILNCLDKQSSWFSLTKGNNFFAYTTDSGSSNLQFSIINRVRYEGV